MPRPAPPGWYPRRGELYRVRLRGGKNRPAIVLSTDALNRFALNVCAVPLTTVHHGEFSLRVPLAAGEAGVERDSWAKCDEVHTVEKRDLLYPSLGRLSTATLHRVEEAVRRALQL